MKTLWSRALGTPSIVLLGTEALVILSVIWASVTWQQPAASALSVHEWLNAFAVAAICLVSLSLHDVYIGPGAYTTWNAFVRIVQSIGIAAVTVVVLWVTIPQWRVGRWVFAPFVVLPFALMLWRWVYESWVHRLAFQRRVLLVGAGRLADDVASSLFASRDHAYEIAGRCAGFEQLAAGREAQGALLDTVKTSRIESLVIALDDSRGKLPVDELLQCKFSGGVRIEDGLSFYERLTGKIHVDAVKPSWLIFSDGFWRARIEWLKRFLDVVTSLVGLTLTAPLGAVIALAIKLDSPGPVFYRQERVGLGGRPFMLIKFRSMRQDAEALTGPVWATDRDQRVTRVGKWLRILRLDELPQMINVLRGDMSFVGPRPERPCFVESLTEQIPYYGYRHTIKPGITGWAQVRYRYGASVQDSLEKLQYDLYYIKNLSLFLDATILVQTVKIMLLGRGAR